MFLKWLREADATQQRVSGLLGNMSSHNSIDVPQVKSMLSPEQVVNTVGEKHEDKYRSEKSDACSRPARSKLQYQKCGMRHPSVCRAVHCKKCNKLHLRELPREWYQCPIGTRSCSHQLVFPFPLNVFLFLSIVIPVPVGCLFLVGVLPVGVFPLVCEVVSIKFVLVCYVQFICRRNKSE